MWCIRWWGNQSGKSSRKNWISCAMKGKKSFTHPHIPSAWNRAHTHSFLFTYRQQAISTTISSPRSWSHGLWSLQMMGNCPSLCTEDQEICEVPGETCTLVKGLLHLMAWGWVPKPAEYSNTFSRHSYGEAWHIWAGQKQVNLSRHKSFISRL